MSQMVFVIILGIFAFFSLVLVVFGNFELICFVWLLQGPKKGTRDVEIEFGHPGQHVHAYFGCIS